MVNKFKGNYERLRKEVKINERISLYSAFQNANQESSVQNLNTTFDILLIKDAQNLNLCCDDLTKGFKFRTIKITDSNLANIDENSFESTSNFTKEFVLMDISFSSNLEDGDRLFNLIKKFENLEGIYIISSNLKELPQNAFITLNSAFGHNLQIVRICNSLISKLYDLTFAHLIYLQWIDLSDNRINRVSANTFTMIDANSEINLRISLSGNRLTTQSIEEGAFSDVKRSIDIYLNDNRIDTLKKTVWYRFLNGEKSVSVHLKNNPLICDCRHHWIHQHRLETEQHFKDAQCQTKKSIFLTSFSICEKQPLIDPFGDVYKKCCRQIQYKNKINNRNHETVLISENHSSDRLVEKTISKTHHDDLKQIKEDVQIKQHIDVPVIERTAIKQERVIEHVAVKQTPVIEHTAIKKAPISTRIDHLHVKPVRTRVDYIDRSVKSIPVLGQIEFKETVPITKNTELLTKNDDVNHEIRTDILTNQRLHQLPPKLHRLISPAVLVKKPLKYHRLVSTQTSNQIRHPINHVVYAESSNPHINLVKINGEPVE